MRGKYDSEPEPGHIALSLFGSGIDNMIQFSAISVKSRDYCRDYYCTKKIGRKSRDTGPFNMYFISTLKKFEVTQHRKKL
jgi:hypothetical protein